MLQAAALGELLLCWIAWSMAFVKPRKEASSQKELASAPASRWGIGLVMVGFALTFAFVRPVRFEKSAVGLIVSMLLGPPSVALSVDRYASPGQAVALQSRDQPGPRTDPVGTVQAGSTSNLSVDAGHAAGHPGSVDVVADGAWGVGRIYNRDRDSYPRGRTITGIAFRCGLRRIQEPHEGLYSVCAVKASGCDGNGPPSAAKAGQFLRVSMSRLNSLVKSPK